MDRLSSRDAKGSMGARLGLTALLLCSLLTLSFAAGSPLSSAASSTPTATVVAFDAPFLGSPLATSPAVVGVVATSDGKGYYVLRANGSVDAYGAPSYGSLAANSLPAGVTATGITLDSTTGGYWIVASNGLVKGFNAPFHGDTLVPPGGWGQHPAAVAIAAAPDGSGYYVLRANGAVYAYGVKGHGSLAGHLFYRTIAPVVAVALAVDPATGGYWIATSTGSVANFDAPSFGSPSVDARGTYDGVPVAALAAAPGGTGYSVLRANGEIDAYGAQPHGSITATSAMPAGGFASALAVDPVTGGYYVALDDTPVGGYLNPFRALTSLLPQEIDQGVDYCASGPVYALGDAVVANLYDPGWPSGVFISYRLTSGPAKGHYVFVAENVTPSVTIGEHVTAATVIGVVHDAKTCLETGWADPPASPEQAAGHVEYNGKNTTAFGLNFSALLASLGVRPGLPQPFGPPGPLPSGWPTW
ncbi:MAG TPA: hypothetical protein VGZ04_08150 [Acidimicrobiales bacterium]|nr:hypothetical protein [Acidimicrobiales bacterium]